VGGLKDAKFFDPGTPVHNQVMTASELRTALGLPKPGMIDFLR
jgi:hypothetical protein